MSTANPCSASAMTPTQIAEIVCAYSPDAGDAFTFYALATRKVRSPILQLRHELSTLQQLNEKALRGEYDLSAISYHAYAHAASSYRVMPIGSSIGDGYGPAVVSTHPLSADDLKGKRIAIPGLLTTAYLALRLMEPDFEPVATADVLEAVRQGAADAALAIRETQLTHADAGFHTVVDLGRWWQETQGLPLPLSCYVLNRNLDSETCREATRLVRTSIDYALQHPGEALDYALQFSNTLDLAMAEKFVGMYVNPHTLEQGGLVHRAAKRLLDAGYEAGFLPRRVEIEYAS